MAAHYGTDFDSEAAAAPVLSRAGNSVLLIGADERLADTYRPGLDRQGLGLTFARSAEEARAQLQQDENILFIIGDLADDVTLAGAVEQLRRNRLHISWARLPALVLVPPGLSGDIAALRASGVMASFMAKPASPQAVVDHILKAHAR